MVILDSLEDIKKKLKINDNGPAQSFMVETCYELMDKYVPMRDNNLRKIVVLDNESVTYASPYASYQYYGKRQDGTHEINPENYTTPGTGPFWDERMKSADMDTLVKQMQDFITR